MKWVKEKKWMRHTDNIINAVMHTRMIVRTERGRACDSITTESAQTAKNSV